MRNFLTEKKVSEGQTFAKTKSTSNHRKSFKDDFLRASVVAVAVAQMTAKVLRRDLFPRLSRSLPLASSRKRDLLKVASEWLQERKEHIPMDVPWFTYEINKKVANLD